ncbi:hypothetical protein [Streptacidiphilus sp. EB103A]|jgi:hypothetical protein|uniref:hypothetical protein n=1 Tax=Streptacidiphilus sp. EB103A TaxID=3156275 RepID=UPI003511DE0C
MDEFTEALIARVRAARTGVAEAVAAHDSYAVSLAVDELEDALRLARDNGVEVPSADADRAAMEQERG